MIKNILFDLDGTLLPMDQDIFVKTYFKLLTKKLEPFGYESHKLLLSITCGISSMIKNDGSLSNEEVFWKIFTNIYGKNAITNKPIFEEFYNNEFQQVQSSCGFNPKSNKVVKDLKSNFKLILATNPIFPRLATESRIKWAGLDKEDFSLITTYENSHHCKPNLDYYIDIINKLNLDPKQCLMVGNDVQEDMVAKNLGMEVFLLTDCLINRDNTDISIFPNGNLEDLLKFIENMKK